jgi:hypothetical protein
MTEYTVWVGGQHPWDRSYQSEVGGVKLTPEQKKKYFFKEPDGSIAFDPEVLTVQTDWRNTGAELPTWDTITDGCIGWGAFADQILGVCKSGDEDNPLFLREIKDCPLRVFMEPRVEDTEDVYIFYNSYEKGNFTGVFELPDNDRFDPSRLVVEATSVINEFELVTDVYYNGEALYMGGDTTGKGVDWYVYHNGNAIPFK